MSVQSIVDLALANIAVFQIYAGKQDIDRRFRIRYRHISSSRYLMYARGPATDVHGAHIDVIEIRDFASSALGHFVHSPHSIEAHCKK